MKNIAEQILEGLSKFYVGFQNRRVLKTMEEIEANTDEQNIPSALLLGEINNKLTADDGSSFQYGITADGRPGWKDGADTVHPFTSSYRIYYELTVSGPLNGYYSMSKTGYIDITDGVASADSVSVSRLINFSNNMGNQYTGATFKITRIERL